MRLALLIVGAPTVLLAQQGGASLSAGATTLQASGASATRAITLAPQFTVVAPTAMIAFNGSLSHFQGSGTSPQGTLYVSTYTQPTASGAMGEVGFAFGGSSHPSGFKTGQGLVSARIHVLRPLTTVSFGGGVGRVWNSDEWSGVREFELGIARTGTYTAWQARVTPTVALDSLHYTDFNALLAAPIGALDWQFSAGTRLGSELTVGGESARVWGGVSVSWWLQPRSALVLSGGTYPVDFTQGFPASRYVSLTLRFGSGRPLTYANAAEAREVDRAAQVAGVSAASFERTADGAVELRVRAPNAARVDWLGDPTQWEASPLEPVGDGWWRVRFEAEGTIELALRLDGGEWVVPPGAEVVTDEFGGRVGRVTLPVARSGKL